MRLIPRHTKHLFRGLQLFANHSMRDNEAKKVIHVDDKGQGQILPWLRNENFLA